MLRRFLFLPFLFLFTLPAHADEKKLHVVASFSILADMIKEIGGDAVEVYSLVPAGSDAHLYEPTPADVQRIKQADLVIINGLGFEGWITRLIASSGYTGKVITASDNIAPLELKRDDRHHAGVDPHAWQDPMFAIVYVMNIAHALMESSPANAPDIQKRAAAYTKKLSDLNTDIKNAYAQIPAGKRKVITSHDAFGYYAKAYGITFLAPLGMNTESEPSAKDIARLIDQIRAEHITALFVENITNPRLIEQLEADSGAHLGGTLYSDALSPPDGPAATYLAMMRRNTKLLADAMAQGSPEKK